MTESIHLFIYGLRDITLQMWAEDPTLLVGIVGALFAAFLVSLKA